MCSSKKCRFPLFGIRVSPDGSASPTPTFGTGSSVGISVIDKAKKKKYLGLASGQTSTIMDANLAWTPDGREIWFRSFDLKEGGTIYGIGMNGRRQSGDLHPRVRQPSRPFRQRPVTPEHRNRPRRDSRGRAGRDDRTRPFVPGREHRRGHVERWKHRSSPISSAPAAVRREAFIFARRTVRLPSAWATVTRSPCPPDGKWVSGYTSPDPATRRYVLLPTGAGEERTITPPGLSLAIVFGWLGSGRYFIAGAKEGGPFRPFVFDQARDTVEPVGIAENADTPPLVSPDSSRFIAQRKNGDWYVYPMAGGEGQELRAMGPHDRPVGWRSDNRSIYMTTHSDDATGSQWPSMMWLRETGAPGRRSILLALSTK